MFLSAAEDLGDFHLDVRALTVMNSVGISPTTQREEVWLETWCLAPQFGALTVVVPCRMRHFLNGCESAIQLNSDEQVIDKQWLDKQDGIAGSYGGESKGVSLDIGC